MSQRDRTILGVVVLLVVLAGGWFFVIQPKRQQASKLGAQLSTAQSELSSVQAQVAGDEAAKSAFGKNYTTLARLGEAVPTNDNVPSLVYQLQNAASGSKVDFRGLTLNPASSSSSTTPTTSSSASQAATAALPPGAAVGEAGFPIEPFTFTFQGNFFHLSNFFHRLQRFVVANNNTVAVSGRLMTLNAISFQASQSGFPQITATISATTYLIPQSQGLLDGATTAGPSGSSVSVATPSSGSSSSAPAVVTPIVR